jgi:hypothetical protein
MLIDKYYLSHQILHPILLPLNILIPTLLAANLGPLIWLLSLAFFIRSPTLFLANRNMNLELSADREKVYKRCVLSPFDQLINY